MFFISKIIFKSSSLSSKEIIVVNLLIYNAKLFTRQEKDEVNRVYHKTKDSNL